MPNPYVNDPMNSPAKIKWWGVSGTERVRRNHGMQFSGYDATCDSCGWDSRTGGAITARVQEAVQAHRDMHETTQRMALDDRYNQD
jgi:hypothetical protein